LRIADSKAIYKNIEKRVPIGNELKTPSRIKKPSLDFKGHLGYIIPASSKQLVPEAIFFLWAKT